MQTKGKQLSFEGLGPSARLTNVHILGVEVVAHQVPGGRPLA